MSLGLGDIIEKPIANYEFKGISFQQKSFYVHYKVSKGADTSKIDKQWIDHFKNSDNFCHKQTIELNDSDDEEIGIDKEAVNT